MFAFIHSYVTAYEWYCTFTIFSLFTIFNTTIKQYCSLLVHKQGWQGAKEINDKKTVWIFTYSNKLMFSTKLVMEYIQLTGDSSQEKVVE